MSASMLISKLVTGLCIAGAVGVIALKLFKFGWFASQLGSVAGIR